MAGFPEQSITELMMFAGFGMVLDNLLSGRLSDRFMPGRVAASVQGGVAFILLLMFFSPPTVSQPPC